MKMHVFIIMCLVLHKTVMEFGTTHAENVFVASMARRATEMRAGCLACRDNEAQHQRRSWPKGGQEASVQQERAKASWFVSRGWGPVEAESGT